MKINKRLYQLSLAAVLALATCIPSQASGSGERDLGVLAYAKRDYVTAISHFQKALGVTPHDALSHYYMGAALLQVKQMEAAQAQFTMAASDDPQGTIGQNARKALATYFPTSAKISSPQPAFVDPNAAFAPAPAVQGAQTQQTPPTVIEQQAYKEASLKLYPLNALSGSQIEATTLYSQAQAQLQYMQSAQVTDARGRAWPAYTSTQITAAQNEFNAKFAQLNMYAQQDTEKKQAYALQLQQELAQSAANLQANINDSTKSGTRIISEGTNLFVRNYAHDPVKSVPVKNPDEEKADQLLMQLQAHKRTATSKTPQANSQNVTGKLLPRPAH